MSEPSTQGHSPRDAQHAASDIGQPPNLTASQISALGLEFDRSGAAWTSWQTSDEGEDEPSTHGRNRVWNVQFGTQWRSLAVYDLRDLRALGTARWHEVLKGESSPVRRLGIHKLHAKRGVVVQGSAVISY
jgi:hypothetical protein